MIPPFRRVRSENRDIRLLQDATDLVLSQVINKQILDGRIVAGIDFEAAGAQFIDHKLDRAPVGFIVIDKNADVNIWSTFKDNRQITLQSNGAATVSIWIF